MQNDLNLLGWTLTNKMLLTEPFTIFFPCYSFVFSSIACRAVRTREPYGFQEQHNLFLPPSCPVRIQHFVFFSFLMDANRIKSGPSTRDDTNEGNCSLPYTLALLLWLSRDDENSISVSVQRPYWSPSCDPLLENVGHKTLCTKRTRKWRKPDASWKALSVFESYNKDPRDVKWSKGWWRNPGAPARNALCLHGSDCHLILVVVDDLDQTTYCQ